MSTANKDEMIQKLLALYKRMFWIAWSLGAKDQDLQEINKEVKEIHKEYFRQV